jgi:hypothetical protein
MTKWTGGLAALMLGLAATTAQAQSFDPRDYQARVHGQKTRILVLGTPHLSGA